MLFRKLHPSDKVRQLNMITIKAAELIGAMDGTELNMGWYREPLEELIGMANERIRQIEEEYKESV